MFQERVTVPCWSALNPSSVDVSVRHYWWTNVERASLYLQKVIDRWCINFKVGEFKRIVVGGIASLKKNLRPYRKETSGVRICIKQRFITNIHFRLWRRENMWLSAFCFCFFPENLRSIFYCLIFLFWHNLSPFSKWTLMSQGAVFYRVPSAPAHTPCRKGWIKRLSSFCARPLAPFQRSRETLPGLNGRKRVCLSSRFLNPCFDSFTVFLSWRWVFPL